MAAAPAIRLPDSLAAWDSAGFASTLKRELAALGPDALPLQQGLSTSSVALADGFSVMVLGTEADGARIVARVGVFYAGLVAGCNCADDPTPVAPQPEYCEVELIIDRVTAEASARLL